jgi:hypothetical protein
MMILEHLKNFWGSYSYLINILGIVVPIALPLYLEFSRKPLKLIVYAYRTFPVITDRSKKIDGLNITISEKATDILSATRLAIWNAGNSVIDSKDIPESDPIRVTPSENVDVFYTKIIEQTKQANQVWLKKPEDNPNTYEMNFGYLDSGDGVLIDIVHNGDVLKGFELMGNIKGGTIKKGSSRAEIVTTAVPNAATLESDEMSGREDVKVLIWTFIVMFILFGLISFFTKSVGSLVASFIFLSAGAYIYKWSKKHYPPPKIKYFDGTF